VWAPACSRFWLTPSTAASPAGTQSARATSDVVAAYRAVLGCELMAAARALRMQGRPPAEGGKLRQAYDLADSALESATADRPLDDDLVAAQEVLGGFAMMDIDTTTESR
jgi:histidine ammonia-lyase